jgi:hypothetical protein
MNFSIRTIIPICILFLLTSCNKNQKNKTAVIQNFETKSYLDIKLDSFGHLPSNPYIIKFEKKEKSITFCGVEHLTDNSDVTNKMFQDIEKSFLKTNPTIAINEGASVDGKKYTSKKEAILRDGEIGLLKYLSDSLKIKTVNGDPEIDYELKELSKLYSKKEFLTYIITERLLWSLYDSKVTNYDSIVSNYDKFLANYIIKKGKLSLSPNEKTFDYFRKNYQELVGRPFDINSLKPTNPFDKNGKFQEIGRKSKEIRDQFLLQKTNQLLKTNNRVYIVFGGWHLLTCEPGMHQIINQY